MARRPAEPARPPVGRRRRGRRGRRGRRRVAAPGAGRRRRRLLPDPRAGHRPGFERTDRRDRRALRPAAADGRGAAASSTWAASPPTCRQRALAAPAVARRGRRRILLDSGVPTAVLRAAVIIGSGSASFEMLRYLTERLPVMITPRWVRHPDPADRDPGRAALPGRRAPTLPAGGDRALRHRRPRRADLPADDAAVRRGRRAAAGGSSCPVPVLHPDAVRATGSAWSRRCRARSPGRWSSRCGTRWSAAEHDIADYVPDPPGGPARLRPGGRAGAADGSGTPTSPPAGRRRRCPARPATRCPPTPTGPAAASTRTAGARPVDASPEALWRVIEGIGGEHGWYSFPLAWRVRGLLDRLVGGVGLRRGRRDPDRLLRRRDASTSGGSRSATRASCCGCAPRCGCRGWPGSSSASERGRAPGGALDVRAAGAVPPARAARPRLLVGGRAVPRHRLRRHGAQHRRRRRGARTRPASTPPSLPDRSSDLAGG